jgi:hypothetical protein
LIRRSRRCSTEPPAFPRRIPCRSRRRGPGPRRADGAAGRDCRGARGGDRRTGLGGGYAEEIALDAAAVVPIPDAMDFVTAAAFPVAYGPSHFALTHRGHLQAGETLLVLGAAGGVGLTAVEIGKAMGARVASPAVAQVLPATRPLRHSRRVTRDPRDIDVLRAGDENAGAAA